VYSPDAAGDPVRHSTPGDFAVLALILGSNLTAAWTGSPLGLSPP